MGIWVILLKGFDPKISQRKLLTFFLYARLLRTLKTLELRSTKACRIDGNPRVGIALEWHQVVLARDLAPELAWKETVES